MSRTIAVIDGNSLMHRAYHAVPPTMNAPDGTPTNAVFGFLNMLLKFVDKASPDAVVCAFDAGKPQFRIEALEQYKAQRPPMDQELRVQFPLIEDILESMGIPIVKVPGWEGDDILGTVAARAEAAEYNCLLVTGDKDACQLASDRTHIVSTKKGISEVVIYDPVAVEERYGVPPERIPDFLGLMGDSSDNIPGVPGIGEKIAAKLLQRFGSMEGIYDNLDQLKGKQLQNLQENKDIAFLSRRIATIVCDLDFPLDLDEVAFPAFEEEAVRESFGKLRLNSQLGKVLSLIGVDAKALPQLELNWNHYSVGEQATACAEHMMTHCNSAAPLGIAIAHAEQESLFESSLQLALSNGEEVAVLEGDAALETLAKVVRSCPFATLVGKDVLQTLYPADSAEAAALRCEELFAARLFDASIAAYVLDSSTTEYTVDNLVQRYLDASLPETKLPFDALAVQAAALFALVSPLKRALEKDASMGVFCDIDVPLIPVLVHMERIGAALDIQHLEQIGAQTQTQIDELEARIYEAAGERFNIDSPKQVGHILFEVVGLKPLKKTTRGYSTDAKVLSELAEEHPLPGLILKYRELAKIKSTYIDTLPSLRGLDKRLHTSFNETVTATGRLSSSNPNLQNIPVRTDFGRMIRECFVPLEEGEVFVSADYSQIELRLLAHLSQDEHLLHAFNSGMDFHAATAARVFGLSLDEVTPQLRSQAKAVNFGIVYGQQAYGLSQSLHIPFGEAKALIDQYFAAYPGVRSYLDEVVADAKSCGWAITMFGRKRHIPELRASNAQKRNFGERIAMNHPMQGSAADIIKLAMIQAQARLNDEFPEAKLILQVHDELDLSVPADQVEGVAALLREVMENVVELRVPLLVDVSWGQTWAQAH